MNESDNCIMALIKEFAAVFSFEQFESEEHVRKANMGILATAPIAGFVYALIMVLLHTEELLEVAPVLMLVGAAMWVPLAFVIVSLGQIGRRMYSKGEEKRHPFLTWIVAVPFMFAGLGAVLAVLVAPVPALLLVYLGVFGLRLYKSAIKEEPAL